MAKLHKTFWDKLQSKYDAHKEDTSSLKLGDSVQVVDPTHLYNGVIGIIVAVNGAWFTVRHSGGYETLFMSVELIAK